MDNTNSQAALVGIDVSKATYDACLFGHTEKAIYGKFDNTAQGHAKLLKWAKRYAKDQAIHFCMEATGAYNQGLALSLSDHRQLVSVVNPHKIHHWSLGRGIGNKTDKADARTIAQYCRTERPELWRMAAPAVRELTALVRHLGNLQMQATQQKNRLSEPGLPPAVDGSIAKLLKLVEDEIGLVEKLIKGHIDQHPDLKRDRDLLVSIPGIADTTAAKILAELPDVNQFTSAQSAAKYAGLSPSQYESGTSIRKRTTFYKGGNRRLKTALYMPAMTAIRYNEPVKRIYTRLIEKGHKGASALGAAMRKLLMIAVGVLRTQQPFRADFASIRLPA